MCLIELPESVKDCPEVVEARTETAKTFKVSKNLRRVIAAQHPVHRKREDGSWEDIDMSPVETPEGYYVQGADWTLDFKLKDVYFKFECSRGNIFECRSLDAPDTSKVSIKKNQIYFEDAWEDVDLYLQLAPQRIEWYKVLKTPEARKSFSWETTPRKTSNLGHRKNPIGFDNSRKETILTHEYSIEPNGKEKVTETFTGEVLEVDPETRVKSASSDVAYPVVVDVPDVTSQISAGPDDATQVTTPSNTGILLISSPVNQFGYGGGQRYSTGLRFTNIGVPQGATITEALLLCYQNQGLAGGAPAPTASMMIFNGVATDDLSSSPWSTTILGKPRTINSGTFVTNADVTTFALVSHYVTAIVESIVGRSGWSSGNALGIIFEPNTTFTGFALSQVLAYEANPMFAPILQITYESTSSIFNAAVGNTTVDAMYLGGNTVDAAYIGDTQS